MRTGAPWRNLPPDFGGWSNTHRRFIRWRDNGVWERLLEILIDEPDFEWLMIDASHLKSTLMRLEQRAAIRIWAVQKGAQHKIASGRGCAWYASQGAYYTRYNSRLYSGSRPDWWLHSRELAGGQGYDTDAILDQAQSQGMMPVIPPKKNRRERREYDKELYKARHLVENAFLHYHFLPPSILKTLSISFSSKKSWIVFIHSSMKNVVCKLFKTCSSGLLTFLYSLFLISR